MSSSSLSTFVRSTTVLLLLFGALPLASAARGADGPIIARAEAVRRPATVDCNKIKAPAKSRLSSPRATDALAQVGAPIKLSDESTPALTAGVWSPTGDSIAFVAPTDRIQSVRSQEHALLADNDRVDRMVGVSVNEIWLYHFPDKAWSKISADGARPRFSRDGTRLFYLSASKGARAVDLATMADESLGIPEAGDPSRRFQTEILSDGSVLSPGQAGGVLRRVGGSESWAAIELAPQDEIRIAPNEERLAVIYKGDGVSSDSAVVVYDRAGTATTVLKNCPGAALHLAWSQDGKSMAYPMRGTGQPEIWVSSLDGGPPATRVRLQPTEGVGAVSFSPDGQHLAFAHTSHKSQEAIWVASKTGMQRIASGLLGQWSFQGDRLLYAVRRSGGGFDWYVVPVTLRSK